MILILVIHLAQTRKTVRTDGKYFGAQMTYRSDNSLANNINRKVIDATWKTVIESAQEAGITTTNHARRYIANTRSGETRRLEKEFDVKVPRAQTGRNLHVKIGWPEWSAPIHYYDYQERGTLGNRIAGYGGQSFMYHKVIGGNYTGKRKKRPGNSGITPMNILPSTVSMFREEFNRALNERKRDIV